MPDKIRLTSEELGLMQLFQQVTRATARDCIIDPKMERVIFVVNMGEMGRAIGKKGANIKNMQSAVGRPVDLVEYSDDAKEFIQNSLNSKFIEEVRLTEKVDGTKIAVVVVDKKQKGAVVGRDGRNAEKARLLAKRYFQISNIHIVSTT